MRFVLPLIVSLLLLPVSLAADKEGVIVRTAKIYREASPAAPLVGQIKAGSRVTIFSRRGGWKEIFSGEKNLVGWIRGYQVREGNFTQAPEVSAEPDDRGILGGLATFSRKASSFFSTGSGHTSSRTATLGVRGLSEQQIQAAEANPEELKRMQGFASDSKRVSEFQSAGKLQSRDVDYLATKQEAAGNRVPIDK